MTQDLYLRFDTEPQANSVLYNERIDSYFPVQVQDETLPALLDTLPLKDAQWDQVVEHEGKLYMADAGKWWELTELIIGKYQKYANIDTIGTIYEGGEWDAEGKTIVEPAALQGWHVNVRLVENEDSTPLEPYAVTPTLPRRVWG
jgi:hypothetical protein